jgi:hypothetical protein
MTYFCLLSPTAHSADFTKYKDTNHLIWDGKFETTVKKYFGARRFDAFYPNGSLSAQILGGLGGPPDQIKTFGKSMFIASACRPHSCDEKAAVVFKKPATILAFGLIHFNCKKEGCDSSPRLSIFSQKNISIDVKNALETWAFSAADRIPVELEIRN